MGRLTAGLLGLVLIVSAPYAWLYYGWKREQPAIQRMGQIGCTVKTARTNPWLLGKLVPARFGWLLDRADRVRGANYSCRKQTPADFELLSRCDHLRVLSLDLDVTDEDLKAISQVGSLRRLHLRCESYTDASAGSIARLSHLEGLWLGYSAVGDSALEQLSQLTELKELFLQSDAVTDSGLAPLRKLPRLESLVLYCNRISDKGLPTLASCPSLRSLRIVSSHCNRAAVERLQQSMPQCHIDWTPGDCTPFCRW